MNNRQSVSPVTVGDAERTERMAQAFSAAMESGDSSADGTAYPTGTSDDGAWIYLSSHTADGTYSCPAGTIFNVSAQAVDYNYWGWYSVIFGVWDNAISDFVWLSEPSPYVIYAKSWSATINTAGLAASSGRYEVAAILWDDNWDQIEDVETFWLNVSAPQPPAPPTPQFTAVPNAIYRFYNNSNGTHFYTPSVDEALTVLARWSNVYTYEGVSYFADPAKNVQPLYRFYNRVNGSHFYTASPQEADTVIARWSNVYSYDGPTYAVWPSAQPGSSPIYRFYNRANGSHFYTASAQEADTVIARWSNVYSYEGPAFWVMQ